MVLSPENYAFIMNVDTLEVDKFQLAPGHMMRRATSDEIVVIKRHVKQFGGEDILLVRICGRSACPVTKVKSKSCLNQNGATSWLHIVVATTS